jgi:guanyl-specific ribonuclease Sa
MKKLNILLLCSALMVSANVNAQSKLKTILKKVATKTTTAKTTTSTTATSTSLIPSNLEIGDALKQALELGVSAGADRLSLKDGFLGNAAVKILMPAEAQKVERTLRSIGLNSLCDNVITSLNRAAEDAAKEAKPIFVAAIKKMTLTDAKNILLGSTDAATQYFKTATSPELIAKFSPIITTSLSKVNATKYYSDLTTQYNKLPLVTPVNTNLTEYVTQKAIDGLFIEVAIEELKIRDNSIFRTTSTLQKVFGFADKN